MERRERFVKAFNHLRSEGIVATQKEAAAKMGAKPPVFSAAMKGDESYLTDRFLRRFNSAFDDIFNLEWLLKGEGSSMLMTAPNASVFNPDRTAGIPLVSQYAYAGYLSGYADQEYIESLPVIDFTPDREMTGNWLAFEVKGDSMDDGSKESYVDGEIVICREVEPDYWRDSRLFINKRDFVIVHEDGILIKRIIEHDVEKHLITIHSLNPMYRDRVINLAEVRQIFSVVESRVQRRR